MSRNKTPKERNNPFLQAILSNDWDTFAHQLSSGVDNRGEFEWNDASTLSPVPLAFEHRRWKMAQALLFTRNWNGVDFFIQPMQEELDEKTTEAFGAITAANKTFHALLGAFDKGSRTPDTNTLDRFEPLLQRVKKEDEAAGHPERTLLRIINRGHTNLPWVKRLLDEGMSANAYGVDDNGACANALGLAAARGSTEWVRQLLAAGANALWKNHKGENAAHLAASLGLWKKTDDGGVLDAKRIEQRLECLSILLAQPGVKEALSWQGTTPQQTLEANLTKLKDEDMAVAEPLLRRFIAQTRQEVLKLNLPRSKPTPKVRF